MKYNRNLSALHLLPPANKLAGRCFQSCVSVHLFRGVPCDHYPECIGPHCTGPHCTSPQPCRPVPDPVPVHRTSVPAPPAYRSFHFLQDPDHTPHPVSDIWWPRLETSSNLFTWGHHWTGPRSPVLSSSGWLLRHVRQASGRYASYWNAFLFACCGLFLAILTHFKVFEKSNWSNRNCICTYLYI